MAGSGYAATKINHLGYQLASCPPKAYIQCAPHLFVAYLEVKRTNGRAYYYLTLNRRAGKGWKKTRRYIGTTLPSIPKKTASPLDEAYRTALLKVKHLAKNRKISACCLFGSYAASPAQANDIDICVVSEGLTADEMSRIALEFGPPVDLSFMERMPHYIAMNVLKEGKPIFISNHKAFSAKWLQVVRAYLQNQPMRERIYSEVRKWMSSQTRQTA